MSEKYQALREALDNDYTRYMGEWAIYERRTPCHWGGEHEEYVIGTKHEHPQLKAPYPIVDIGQGVPPVKGDPPIPVLSIRKEHAEYIVAADPATIRALLADHDRLQAQVEQLRTEAKVASDRIQELGRFTKAQRGEIEGLRADAQRYNAFFDAGLPITFLGQPYYTKADLDEAIDSARAGREDGNG